jgi:hypothetical protein
MWISGTGPVTPHRRITRRNPFTGPKKRLNTSPDVYFEFSK